VVRVLVVFLAVLAAGLSPATQLTSSAAETAYRDAVAARLRMIALHVAATIQTSQSLGIALEAQDTLPALIGREAAGVPDLAGIEVVDSADTVLFTAMPATVTGEAVTVPLVDDLGQEIGAVRMLRDVTNENVRLATLRGGLMSRALPIGIGILVIAGLALAALARRHLTPGGAGLRDVAALDAEGSP